MNLNTMERRTEELLKLKAYTEDVDKDLTMILQSLQWDRKHILEHSSMVSCKLDGNHRVLTGKIKEHEQECLLRHNGYTAEDQFLPDPLDTAAGTLIKLTKQDIKNLIDNAAKLDPTFQRGVASGDMEPQSLARLQCAYSADERRAIHDAVVSAAPSCHDLTDLALPSGGEDSQNAHKTKSRTEILAELRDMRRRRTKYRVAAKSKNYSDVLRDVIKSQMELYNEVLGEVETKPDINELNAVINKQTHSEPNDEVHYRAGDRDRYEDRRDRRETDRDRQQSRGERSDRDYRNKRYGEDQSRDRRSRDDCSDRRYDHRPRELSKEIKVEVIDENNDHRERSGNTRHRDKYKERKYDEKEDKDHKRKGRHDEEYCRDEDRNKRKRKDKSKEKSDPDVERARNLIRDIKREIESVERSQGDEDGSVGKESAEVGHYRDYNHDSRRVGDESKRHRRTNLDYSHNDRSRDRFYDRSNRDYKMHRERKDEREIRETHKKSKVERHKESYRSEDNKTKRSRTEDKHKRYYEIYSELDKRRNNKSNDDND